MLILSSDSFGGDLAFHKTESLLGYNNKSLSHEIRPRLGRSKPLGAEAARQAAKMRKVIACLRCSAMKLKVRISVGNGATTSK